MPVVETYGKREMERHRVVVLGDVTVDRETGAIVEVGGWERFLCAACGGMLAGAGESVCAGCLHELMAGGPAWEQRPVPVFW